MSEMVGRGAIWEKETRNGKMLSGVMDFQYNGHLVTAKFIAFKNQGKKEGERKPDWNIFVEDSFPTNGREIPFKPQPKFSKEEMKEELPF
jgi:hypothetical protein